MRRRQPGPGALGSVELSRSSESPTPSEPRALGSISTATPALDPAVREQVASLLEHLAAEARRWSGSSDIQLADLGQPEAQCDRVAAPAAYAPMPEILTADDLAELLQLDVRTVRRHARMGLLPPSIGIGRALRWRRATIDKWVKEREQ